MFGEEKESKNVEKQTKCEWKMLSNANMLTLAFWEVKRKSFLKKSGFLWAEVHRFTVASLSFSFCCIFPKSSLGIFSNCLLLQQIKKLQQHQKLLSLSNEILSKSYCSNSKSCSVCLYNNVLSNTYAATRTICFKPSLRVFPFLGIDRLWCSD